LENLSEAALNRGKELNPRHLWYKPCQNATERTDGKRL